MRAQARDRVIKESTIQPQLLQDARPSLQTPRQDLCLPPNPYCLSPGPGPPRGPGVCRSSVHASSADYEAKPRPLSSDRPSEGETTWHVVKAAGEEHKPCSSHGNVSPQPQLLNHYPVIVSTTNSNILLMPAGPRPRKA